LGWELANNDDDDDEEEEEEEGEMILHILSIMISFMELFFRTNKAEFLQQLLHCSGWRTSTTVAMMTMPMIRRRGRRASSHSDEKDGKHMKADE
jgi:hypothetical protein